jgi:hypothetical protein
MALFASLVLALSVCVQGGGASSAAGDILNSTEKAQMERADSIDRRIKVYGAASKRIQQTLQDSVLKEDFGVVPEMLNRWTALLALSLQDIEANLKSKKRSRSLINYEIQVRKAIANTQSLKVRAPIDQQDAFDSCLSQAEAIRKKLVEILFNQSG